MSVGALVASARKARGTDDGDGRGPVFGSADVGAVDNETSTTSDALTRIVACIPSEVVLVYVATTAAIVDTTNTDRAGQWVAFWAYLAATPVVVLLGVASRASTYIERLGQLRPKHWPWPQMAVATTSFAIWAFTLPNSPFGDYTWYHPSVATVVLLAGSLALGLSLPLLGIGITE